MNQQRRRLLTWVTPTIIAVSLPSHAQTSACSSLDLVGVWALIIDDTPPGSVFGPPIGSVTLGSDGGIYGKQATGNEFWSLNGDAFTMSTTDNDFAGTTNVNCNLITGFATNKITNAVHPFEASR